MPLRASEASRRTTPDRLLGREAVREQGRILRRRIGPPADAGQPLQHGLEVHAEQLLHRRHARVVPLLADRLEAERGAEEIDVARRRLDDAVVARPDRAREEVRGVEEARERPLRRRVHVDGEVEELAHTAAVVAQHRGLVAIELVGHQPARRVEPHTQRPDELAGVVGEKSVQVRILLAPGTLSSASRARARSASARRSSNMRASRILRVPRGSASPKRDRRRPDQRQAPEPAPRGARASAASKIVRPSSGDVSINANPRLSLVLSANLFPGNLGTPA